MPGKCELEQIAKVICNANGFGYQYFINSGAYKETYRVNDGTTSYALKVFKPNNSHERAAREIDAMQRLSCENIVKLLKVDLITYNGATFLYLVEEFLSGGSLGDVLKQAPYQRKTLSP